MFCLFNLPPGFAVLPLANRDTLFQNDIILISQM